MPSALRLIAASPDARDAIVAALARYGVAHRDEGKMVVVDSTNLASGHVIALLRDALPGPERDAVSVVEDLGFRHEFPVTTRLEAWWSVFETSWFGKAVAEDAFSIWFQPVVDTEARRTIGHECLLRLTPSRRQTGGKTRSTIDACAFDAYVRQVAIREASAQIRTSMSSPGGLCFLNFVPSRTDRPEEALRGTAEALRESGLPPENLVLQAAGPDRNPDILSLRRIEDYLREQGIGFALDDVHADAGALRLLCDLRPDYIKLERSLVHRMEQPREAAAVSRLVEVAARLGVGVVAKGVERIRTVERLWAAGIRCMQGHLFGSPSPDFTDTGTELARIARTIPPSAHPEWRESLVSVGLS